ncbi:MAG: class I SAM-dependent methyltransferase [Flavobacteriales bacterium]|nr:class I SAM-dependent methyltransferase [Flavobacteriales bacterium]
MKDSTTKIIRRYDRIARFYDLVEGSMEMMIPEDKRREVFEGLAGNLLEIGVGTGKNIKLYPANLCVTAIDFSSKMLAKARDKAGILNKNVELLLMDAQQMSFNDNTFDYVVATCVFCSVPDPIKGFKEIRRVLKPGGKAIFIEHVRSEQRLLGLLMDIMNPLTVNLYGANINRRTEANILEAGFDSLEVTNLWKDIVKKIVITNKK